MNQHLERRDRSAETGATLGGIGGAATGAIAGSAIGPAGVVIGAVVGGIAGAAASGIAVGAIEGAEHRNESEPEVEELENRSYQDDAPAVAPTMGDYDNRTVDLVYDYENRTIGAPAIGTVPNSYPTGNPSLGNSGLNLANGAHCRHTASAEQIAKGLAEECEGDEEP